MLTRLLSLFSGTNMYLVLGLVLSSIACYTIGDYHGHKAEHTSMDNIQRIAIIKNQNDVIAKMMKAQQINDKSIADLQAKNDTLATNYQTITKELYNDQDIINSNNRINAHLMRIIQSAASGSAVPKTSASSSRTNENTTYYKPTDAIGSIDDGFKQCNQIRNQLLELQNNIIAQVKNANR